MTKEHATHVACIRTVCLLQNDVLFSDKELTLRDLELRLKRMFKQKYSELERYVNCDSRNRVGHNPIMATDEKSGS